MTDVNRPMDTAPRDGTLIRLRMGADQDVTAGWWNTSPLQKRYPWRFLDRQTEPGSHFLNSAKDRLPIAWAPMGGV